MRFLEFRSIGRADTCAPNSRPSQWGEAFNLTLEPERSSFNARSCRLFPGFTGSISQLNRKAMKSMCDSDVRLFGLSPERLPMETSTSRTPGKLAMRSLSLRTRNWPLEVRQHSVIHGRGYEGASISKVDVQW